MKILFTTLAIFGLVILTHFPLQKFNKSTISSMPDSYNLNDTTHVTPPVSGPLESYTWENRLIVLFTPSTGHPAYQAQLESLEKQTPGLRDRDLRILHAAKTETVNVAGHQQRLHRVFTGEQITKLYANYEIDSASFVLLLIGKDGTVKMRRTGHVAPGEIFERIDQMPMRRREMQE